MPGKISDSTQAEDSRVAAAAHILESDHINLIDARCTSCDRRWPCPSAIVVRELRLLQTWMARSRIIGDERDATIANLRAELAEAEGRRYDLEGAL